MVSAICPKCKIDLIEATNSGGTDLFTASDEGVKLANYESNSYGGSEVGRRDQRGRRLQPPGQGDHGLRR